MPVLWRFLLCGYFRVFFLSVCTFIAVLLVSRFKDIARFTALSGDFLKTGWFVAYQIPLILPIAIPISALIASFLLFQRLSRTFELTALRASGLSLKALLTPLLLLSLLLSLLHFSFCAEISPFCRRESKTLFYRETTANPLLLLQRQKLVKIKHAYLNMKVKEDGTTADDFTLITHNESNQRLSLFSARHLRIANEKLLGYDVAIISYLHSEKEGTFDPLIIENQTSMSTAAPLLSTALKKNRPHLEPNALSLRMLCLRSEGFGKQAKAAFVEILRRLTLSLAVFSFTLLGCAFGHKGLWSALLLALILLISYFLGKELKSYPFFAIIAFFFPHPLIWLASIAKLRRLAQGVS